MNVLFLTHSFPRSEGDAAGSFLLRLAIALRAEDVNVRVVAPAAAGLPAAEEISGIRVERFRYAPRRYEKLAYTGNMARDVASSWSARLALVGFLGSDFVHAVRARRSFEPEIVHAHSDASAGASLSAAAPVVAGRAAGCTIHDVNWADRPCCLQARLSVIGIGITIIARLRPQRLGLGCRSLHHRRSYGRNQKSHGPEKKA